MNIPADLSPFWNAFVRSTRDVEETRFYEAFSFGDSEELANELAALVLRGVKRATAGALWSFEAEGKRLPAPGDLSIVTSGSGEPLCIIETRSVDVLPFAEVGAEFAATEGEGDGSLSYWQAAHRQYFTRECARAGRQFAEDMLVVCERFSVVYRQPFRDPMPSPNARSASCTCGQLTAEVSEEPIRVSICHCLACQRRTGGVFATQARFRREAVTVSGQSTSYVRVGDSGGRATFHFCPTCGDTVYYNSGKAGEFTAIPVGAFADPGFPQPTISVYEERKHPWVILPGNIEHMA